MMSSLRTGVLVAALSFVAGAGAMWAQQQAQASHREPQFENAQLKAWKTVIMPKQPLTLHRHEHGRALIALTDGVLDVVNRDGKTLQTYDWKKGKAYWLDADPAGQMHADVNHTTKPIEVIVVELQNDQKKGK